MKQTITIVAIATALLSACGGGGSSSSSDSDPADKYVGTWKGRCLPNEGVLQSADNKITNTVTTIKMSKVNANTVNTEQTHTVYANSDITCGGTAIGSVVKTGLNTNSFSAVANGITSNYGQNLITYDSSATLASGKKVEQVTYSESNLGPNANGTLSAGNIKVFAAYYSGTIFKAIVYLSDANTLILTPPNTTTAGYPTVVIEDLRYTFFRQ